jgi:hypothetical protein
MMKKHIIIISTLLVIASYGCVKDVLEKRPLDRISGDLVFEDKSLTDAFLNDIYTRTQFQITSGQAGYNMGLVAGMGMESRAFGNWQAPSWLPLRILDPATGANALEYWPYENIRAANEFIKNIRNSGYDEDYIRQRVSEVRFLRAMMYFQMVKRYGGVPLVLDVLSPDAPDDSLFVPRNTEKEVYDFIASEMDDIATTLPETYPAEEDGRPTRYAALALKSRAMLYAASEAQFGTLQLNGLVGMPSGEAESYWQKAYDASLEIIENGPFSLYNKYPDDKAENFHQLLIDKDNSEVIFKEKYDAALGKYHNWDYLCEPDGFRAGWGSNFNPFLDFVDLFEFTDGRPGTLDRSKMNNSTLWNLPDTFALKDPRFRASVFYPECSWQGSVVYFHKNTIWTNPATGERETVNSGTIGDDNWPAAAPARNYKKTGFLVRKRVDESLIKPISGEGNTDFVVFRLGEILLNAAEAAYYLGHTNEALQYVNQIRERAGMPAVSSVTEEIIRHERRVELALEEHSYWDLRRWRIAQGLLDGYRTKGIQYTYDYDARMYILKLVNAETAERVFPEKHYYLPIGVERISDNPQLVENPGY